MRKLTDEDYEEIRQMYVEGVSKADICRKKGVSKYYVDNIIYGIKGVPHYHTHHENTRKMPAGGLSPEMIAEVKRQLKIGDAVITNTEEYGRKRGRVVDKYPFHFMVQLDRDIPARVTFQYADLLTRGNEVRLDRRHRT
uniref:Veg family protein n=1 Tax=Coprococcus catus TaxID=116085 RepID=UPI0022DF260B|nr:Veg family protein [Coprococcus catus]